MRSYSTTTTNTTTTTTTNLHSPPSPTPSQPNVPSYSAMYQRLLERPDLAISGNVNEMDCMIRITITCLGSGDLKSSTAPVSTFVKTTMLFTACYENKVDIVKTLLRCSTIQYNEPQEVQTNLTALHASNLSGNVQLLAMLLLFGCKPQPDALNRLPRQLISPSLNPQQRKELNNFWANYRKKGLLSIFVEFDEIYSNMLEITRIPKPNTAKAESEIQRYINSNPTEPDLEKKILSQTFKPTSGTSLVEALNTLLKYYKFRKLENNKTLKDFLEESGEEFSKCSVIQSTTRLFSVNIFVLVYNSESKEPDEAVKCIKFYCKPLNKDACPYLYLAFNGVNYIPVEDASKFTPFISLFEMIHNNFSCDFFVIALAGADMQKINDLHPWKPPDAQFVMNVTLLYFAARLGRTEIVRVLLQVEGINVDGVQEQYEQNSPLHVSNYRGHFNIVAMLLYKGANPDQLNIRKDKPNLMNDALPIATRQTLQNIWTSYKEKGLEKFRAEIQNFIIKEPIIDTGESSTPSTDPPDDVMVTGGNKITLDQLCSILENENPVSGANLKCLLEQCFNINEISVISAMHKATPLYISCRNGCYDQVKVLINVGKAKLDGPQETRSGEQNTCLHVANWRGHVRIVALLLLNGAKVEPKKGGNKLRPGVEINQTLPEETRTALNALFTAASASGDKNTLLEMSETEPNTLGYQLPLWAYLALPKDQLPPQYAKLEFTWYEKNNDRLVLLDLVTCSHLTCLYKVFLLSPSSTSSSSSNESFKEILIPVPPIPPSIFNGGTTTWTYVSWRINFTTLQASRDKKNFYLAPIARTHPWYYTSSPTTTSTSTSTRPPLPSFKDKETPVFFVDSPLIPFPSKISATLNDAFTVDLASVSFPFIMSKRFLNLLSPPALCWVNLKLKNIKITNNGKTTYHHVYNEPDQESYLKWQPFIFDERDTKPPDGFFKLNMENNRKEISTVCSNFYLSMPQRDSEGQPINSIVSIHRLFNKEMRRQWEQQQHSILKRLNLFHTKYCIKINKMKMLWNVTKSTGIGGVTTEEIVQNGWINFKRLHNNEQQWWGSGVHFTPDAAFASGFAFQDKVTGNRKMFFSEVLVGHVLFCPENPNLENTPERYDSLAGFHDGSWVYVIYEPLRAFPTYLVEFSPSQ